MAKIEDPERSRRKRTKKTLGTFSQFIDQPHIGLALVALALITLVLAILEFGLSIN